jgi:predicted outer membrane lipoprotein
MTAFIWITGTLIACIFVYFSAYIIVHPVAYVLIAFAVALLVIIVCDGISHYLRDEDADY